MAITTPITALYALPLTLLVFYLGFRVTTIRRAERIGVGYGKSRTLMKAASAHSNAVENIPLILLLFLMLEMNNGPAWLLHLLGVLLLFARIIHAFGLSKHAGKSFGRTVGMIVTWNVMIFTAVFNLYFVLI